MWLSSSPRFIPPWFTLPRLASPRLAVKFFARAALAPMVFALAACGFQPLYSSPRGGGLSTAEHMATVRIALLPDRIGQQLHNMLRDRLNPLGPSLDPAYDLRVVLIESRQELSIRKDETARRANLIVSAQFSLKAAGTEEVVLTGRAASTNSFNILSSQFATTSAELDARERGLREISDDIRTRLGIYFVGLGNAPS